jgi:hypothetical protein
LSDTENEVIPIASLIKKPIPINSTKSSLKRGRGRPKKEDRYNEQLPYSKSKIKVNKDHVTIQRRINEEKESLQIAKDLIEKEERNPIKLDKYKKENDL